MEQEAQTTPPASDSHVYFRYHLLGLIPLRKHHLTISKEEVTDSGEFDMGRRVWATIITVNDADTITVSEWPIRPYTLTREQINERDLRRIGLFGSRRYRWEDTH